MDRQQRDGARSFTRMQVRAARRSSAGETAGQHHHHHHHHHDHQRNPYHRRGSGTGERTAVGPVHGSGPPASEDRPTPAPVPSFIRNSLTMQLSMAQPPSRLVRGRTRKREEKASAASRAWVRVEPSGEARVVRSNKLSLAAHLGIQPRDLRLLESQLSNQVSVILRRDRAVVINMAFVKTIITTDACYVVSPDDERSLQFMAELKLRLAEPLRVCKAAARGGGGGTAAPTAGWAAFAQQALELPFELRVLEICLDELTCDMDERATQLEAAAYPAVDAMARDADRPNLDRVRRVKNSLSHLLKITQSFLDALEALLDNDKDMWDMNLGARGAAKQLAEEERGAGGPGGDSLSAGQLPAVAEEGGEGARPSEAGSGDGTREPGAPTSHGHPTHMPTPPHPFLSPHVLQSVREDEELVLQDVQLMRDSGEGLEHWCLGDGSPMMQSVFGSPTGGFGGAMEQRRGAQHEGEDEDEEEEEQEQQERSSRGALPRVYSSGYDAHPYGEALQLPGNSVDGPRASHGQLTVVPPLWGPEEGQGTARTNRDCGFEGPGSPTVHPSSRAVSFTAPGDAGISPRGLGGTPRATGSMPGWGGGDDDKAGPGAVRIDVTDPPAGTPLRSSAARSSGGGGGGVGGSPEADGLADGWHGPPQLWTPPNSSHQRVSPFAFHTACMADELQQAEAASQNVSNSQHASLARVSRRSLAALSTRHGSSLASSSALSSVFEAEVAEVEMLLTAYFLHVNSVARRLKNLNEYVEDTEDLVEALLDAQRNRLLAYDLFFIGINAISMAVTAISGLFAMNLFHPEGDFTSHPSTFIWLACASLFAYLLFTVLLSYYMATGVVRFTR